MTKLQKAKAETMKLWREMCIADNIPTAANFVTFSPENPVSARYNKAVHNYMRMRARANRCQLDAVDQWSMSQKAVR